MPAAPARRRRRRPRRWTRVTKACHCGDVVHERIPPWTERLVAPWPDGRVVTSPECRRGHRLRVTAGDVRRAA